MATEDLSDKARRARQKYQREWRTKNPDKVRQYIKEYWERKAAAETKNNNQHGKQSV